LGFVLGLSATQPQLRGDLAGAPASGAGVVRAAGTRRGAGSLDARHDPGDAPHRLGQQPGVGGVVNVGRHHGGVGADFPHPQQLRLHRLGQRLVELVDHLVPTPGGDLHQGGRMLRGYGSSGHRTH
jgi:hypothetical protein